MNSTLLAATPSYKRPEIELLLCCARTSMETSTVDRVSQLLKGEINWNYLNQTALLHGILPLLVRNLNNLSSSDIPKGELNHLQAAFHTIVLWNLYLTGELLRLLKLFQNAGIRTLPYKGPTLAVVAYGNPVLRHFGDLDILMPREDILKAKGILISQGYHTELDFTPREEADYLRSHHDYKFIRATDGIVVEIQWGVTQWSFAFPIDFEEIWRRREKTSITGGTVFNLSIEDTLLILCVHGTKHRWGQLRWICDIVELVHSHQQRIDWEWLIENARALGGMRMLLLGLFVAYDLLDATLPKHVLRKIHHDSRIRSLANQVLEGLFRDPSHATKLLHEQPFFYLQTRERLGDKAALVWRYFPEYFQRVISRVGRVRNLASSLSPFVAYYFINS